MADTALHSMTANTAPAAADELYILDDPGGSPADNRITHTNLMKVNGLTEDTAPDRTADYMLTYDNSASAAKKVLLGKIAKYYLCATSASASNDPADATTYYFGEVDHFALNTTAEPFLRIYVPLAGTMIGAEILAEPDGTAASAETSTLYVRKNGSADTTLTSSLALNATYHETVTGLSLALAAGDYVMLKWVTPTWATNPTDVYFVIKLIIA